MDNKRLFLRLILKMDDTDNFIQAGVTILKTLAEAYSHPENYKVLSWNDELYHRVTKPEPLPFHGQNMDETVAEAIQTIFRGYCNVSHPQYYGYISPRPLPVTVLGDLLAMGLNQTPGAWRAGPAATAIETETLHWLSEFIGYQTPSGNLPNGIVTNGGTMANASAIKLARDTLLGREVQSKGVWCANKPTIYMSREGHFSVWKSVDFLGLGRESLRLIEVDEQGCIDLNALEDTIQRDLRQGYQPICLIGVAGTSATGAVDALDTLADVAAHHNMWFHVDAASGGAYANLAETRQFFTGIERADSVTLDPCKWFFVSFGIGCLLVKNGEELRKSFYATGHYWEETDELDIFQMSFPGTRQWRTLGLWLAFRHLGEQGYKRILSHNLKVTHDLAATVVATDVLELLHKPVLPVCCFRVDQIKSPDTVTMAIQRFLVASNHYVTLLDWRGHHYLRAAISNFATESSHVYELVQTILTYLDTNYDT